MRQCLDSSLIGIATVYPRSETHINRAWTVVHALNLVTVHLTDETSKVGLYVSFSSLTDAGPSEVQSLHVSEITIIGHMKNVDEDRKETDLVGIIGMYGILTWGREWPPTPGFLPGESHGQRSLAGYSLWGCKSRTRPRDLHTYTYGILKFPLSWSCKCTVNTFI